MLSRHVFLTQKVHHGVKHRSFADSVAVVVEGDGLTSRVGTALVAGSPTGAG
jgi:hypothetical protein